MNPTILLSAGDASGEASAAALVRELRGRWPDARFLGLGGPRMAAAGVELLADSRELAVGGLFELAGSLRRVLRARRALVKGLRESQPDLVVLIDSGGFNLPLARRVRELTRARVLYYAAPQIWAWRGGRLPKLVERTDRIAVLFPFERDYYASRGVRVDYVGHPVLDGAMAAPIPVNARAAAREKLGLDDARPVVALLPGSRRNEIEYHLPVQLAALRRLRAAHPEFADLQGVIGLAPSLDPDRVRRIVGRAGDGGADQALRFEEGGVDLFDAADVALTKPGTVTVELMLRERPMVVMARANPLTAALVKRQLRVPWLAMPNLIANAAIVPELLQAEANPDRIAAELAPLLVPTTGRPEISSAASKQIAALARARETLGPPGASARVARLVEEMLNRDE